MLIRTKKVLRLKLLNVHTQEQTQEAGRGHNENQSYATVGSFTPLLTHSAF